MTYKAIIEQEHFSRSGWDSSNDTEIVYLYDDSLPTLKLKVKEYIKENEYISKGDFGITLSSVSCKLISYQEVEVERILNVLEK